MLLLNNRYKLASLSNSFCFSTNSLKSSAKHYTIYLAIFFFVAGTFDSLRFARLTCCFLDIYNLGYTYLPSAPWNALIALLLLFRWRLSFI